MTNPDTTGLLRIGELAREAGLSVSTVKYYVKEGLVSPSCKTGPNMAYYAPDCVARIRLIKSLQKERFYPLSVIRGLLASGADYERELGLLDAIHKVNARSRARRCGAAEAARLTGLTRAQLAQLTESGVLRCHREERRALYEENELRVMELVRRRLDAGMPLEHTITAFSAYEAGLREAVRQDIDSLINAQFLHSSLTTEQAVQLIRISDETLDSFIALRRAEFNRDYGSLQLEMLDAFAADLERGRETLLAALRGLRLGAAAARCMETGDERGGVLARSLWYYGALRRATDGGIIRRAMLCGEAFAWFRETPEASPAALNTLLVLSLRALWLSRAPAILDAAALAAPAREALRACAAATLGPDAPAYLRALET